MLIKWIKRILRIIFVILIWQKTGPIPSIIFFLICIPIDLFALSFADKLAIKGFQEGEGEEARQEAIRRFEDYQKIPGSPSTRLVTFSQLILGPILSISIPIIIAGFFLKWFI